MVWYSVEFLVNFFEMFLFSFFTQNYISNRVNEKRLWLTLIIASVCMLFFNVVGEVYILVAQYTFMFAFAIYFLTHKLLTGLDYKHILISVVQFFVILLLADIVTLVVMKIFANVGVEGVLTKSSDRLVAMVLSKTTVLFLIQVFKSIRSQDVHQSKSNLVFMYLSLLFINIMLSMTMLYAFRWIRETQFYELYLLLGSSGIIGVNLFILFFTNHLVTTNKKEQDNLRIKQQNLYYEKYISDIEQSREAFHKLHHNYKHDIQCISGLTLQSEYDDLKEYVASINERLEDMEFTNYSCPVPLNALLNAKKDFAINEGVDLQLSVFMPAEVTIDDYDLCNIVGNILDNGIEACENLEKKELILDIYINKKMLFIHSINAMASNLLYDKDKIATTKRDKELHGYGLNIINELANKYGGYSTIKTENQKFDMMVGIPFK